VRIRKIADDPAKRVRQLSHQRWNGDDLVLLREARILQQVDDLDLVAAGEMLFAQLFQVAQGSERLRRLARGVKAQVPFFPGRAALCSVGFGVGGQS
jgi:hypothetical protein